MGTVIKWLKAIILWFKRPALAVAVPLPTFHREPEGVHKFKVKKDGFKPSWIVIHHSATRDNGTKNWDAIRKFHIEKRGWSDIGYHLGVENVNGKLSILDGRPIGEVGAHAIGFNMQSIGICLVGNYDIDPPSEDRLDFLVALVRDLQKRFKIPRQQVVAHRETYGIRNVDVEKSCPGSQFDLNVFRSRLA